MGAYFCRLTEIWIFPNLGFLIHFSPQRRKRADQKPLTWENETETKCLLIDDFQK